MSFDALAWAAKQNPGNSSMKLVLLALAECASRKEALAFPSLAELSEFSCLDRKTIIASLDKLVAVGMVLDTGRCVGRTGQIKVYQLNLETVPKTEQYQKRNGTVFSGKSTENGTRNQSEPVVPSRAKALSGRATGLPSGEEEHVFRVYCVQWAAERMGWDTRDAGAEYERFTDNAIAKGSKYIDWQAAWRNWCRSPYCKTTSPEAAATAYRKEPLRV